MAYAIGDAYVDRFSVLDSEGALLTGVEFTADQNRGPGESVIDWEVSEIGTGLYELQFPIADLGLHYLRLVTDTTPFQVFEFSLRTTEYEVGDTLVDYFTVRDVDGNYYGGAEFDTQHALDPSGGAFAATIEDLLNGLYRVSWDGAAEGVWTLRIVTNNLADPNEPQLFEFEHRVFPLTVAETSPLLAATGASLDELVRAVARTCRDILEVRATADAPDAQTWPDARALGARSPKSFKGADLFVTAAALSENLAQTVRVIDSIDGSLVLAPALPAPPRRGDRGYLVNLESVGFERETYAEAINESIETAFPNALAPAVWTYPEGEEFDPDFPFLTPPAEFTHLYDVSYDVGLPYDTHIPFTDSERAGWYWDGAAGVVAIMGGYRASAIGGTFTLRGFGRPPRLEEDTDQTDVDFEWLVQYTAGTLIISTRDARRMAEGSMRLNRADALRIKLVTPLPPNTIRIR